MKDNLYHQSIRKSVFLFVLNFIATSTFSADILFDQDLKNSYQYITELRLELAQSNLDRKKQTHPDHPGIPFLEDYIDFFKIYLTEDKTLFKSKAGFENLRLQLIDKNTAINSPYRLYLLGEINLHWALLYIKFGNYVSGFNRIRKAFNLLNLNHAKFPDFTPTQKSLGFIHALLSTLPGELKWLVKTFGGMKGNIHQAKFELEQAVLYGKKNDFIFKDETIVLYALVISEMDNDLNSAWKLLQESNLDPTKSPLMSYLFGYVALRNHDGVVAIRYLESHPKGSDYFEVSQIHYLLGLAKLRQLDLSCKNQFELFIKKHKGQHLIKDSYQKLAWVELLKNNSTGYWNNMTLVKQKGTAINEDDKQALYEANQKKVPHIDLLKARLLFDGGHYEKALDLIVANHVLLSEQYIVESTYRLARIHDLMNNKDLALTHYTTAATKGKNQSPYYACASYLYLGQLYENKGNKKAAKSSYENCIALKPDTYATSLHQKAKAGLNRL